MENIPRLSSPVRHPRIIEIHPYLYDHHIEGRIVLPAADMLIELARAVKINFPQAVVQSMTDAYFPRFLTIPTAAETLSASVDTVPDEAGGITAALFTSIKSKTGDISRTVEHARVKFNSGVFHSLPEQQFRCPGKLEGDCINVSAALIYRELVPFGAAYQNIVGDLSVSRFGALGCLSGGDADAADDDDLGSPFPFDAALHMACVWAQCFTNVVPFPVGLAKRTIYQKTRKHCTYLGSVVPVAFTAKPFVFNAWIFDLQGSVCEVMEGIQMMDVTQGRMKPPLWLREKAS